MGQLVGDQLLTIRGVGIVRSLAKEHVLAGGERLCPKLVIQLIGLRGGVHAHPAQVVPYRLAHLCLQGSLQRLPSPALAIDALGCTVAHLKGALPAALGQQALHGLVAEVPVQARQSSKACRGFRGLSFRALLALQSARLGRSGFFWHPFLLHHLVPLSTFLTWRPT